MNASKEAKGFILDENFWDCECETRYIHPKSHEACRECFARREEQPDSIEVELLEINMAGDNKFISLKELEDT